MSGEENGAARSRAISPIELLSIAGFSFGIAWMIVVFYWFFRFFPQNVSASSRDFAQLWVFVGMACGFFIIHLLGKNPKFTPFSSEKALAGGVVVLALPVAALFELEGMCCPFPLMCFLSLLTGAAGSFVVVCWLDICSRLRTTMFGRFTGLSFLFGTLAFALTAVAAGESSVLFGSFYALASIGLVLFVNDLADANDERAHLESIVKGWGFAREIDPSLFMLGIAFGMTFAWVFREGDSSVFLGLISIAPGALLISLLSALHVRIEVTMMLRILLCVCVASCVFMPLASERGRLACSLVVIAAWAMFSSLNYSFMIKKSVVMRDAPLFRQAPLRLAIPEMGFALGWVIIYLCTLAFGAGSEPFTWISSFVSVALVAVFMLFFPAQGHHTMDGEPVPASQGSYLGLAEKEAWDLRIRAVVEKYRLTPREEDILRHLARGRNAAYIQEQLVVSPHTVKSHVYNIYKKLDVHSQQQLIDLVDYISLEESGRL